MIEFSSIGVQTMFLAYIGGLFWILSENENESTSQKKNKKNIRICKKTNYIFFVIFWGHVLSFSFSDWIQKSPPIYAKNIVWTPIEENSITTQTLVKYLHIIRKMSKWKFLIKNRYFHFIIFIKVWNVLDWFYKGIVYDWFFL